MATSSNQSNSPIPSFLIDVKSQYINPDKTTNWNTVVKDYRPRKRLGFKTLHEVFHQSLNRVALLD